MTSLKLLCSLLMGLGSSTKNRYRLAEVCAKSGMPFLHDNQITSFFLLPFFTSLVAMYREPSLHDVGETVPKAGVTPSKSTSASAIMNGGKPVNKCKTT